MRKTFTSALCILLCISVALLAASCGADEFDNRVTLANIATTTAPSTTAPQDTELNDDYNEPPSYDYSEPEIGGEETETVKFTYTGKVVQKQTIAVDTDYLGGYSGMRDVTSAQLVKDMRLGITISEYLDGVENDISSFLRLAYKMKNDGFNAVRLTVNVGGHIDEDYTISAAYLNKIKSAVDALLRLKMYCILCVQGNTGWLSTSQDELTRSRGIITSVWSQLAAQFRSYNDYLLFESISGLGVKNINYTNDDIESVNLINAAFVSAVRSTGGNNEVRHIIVSTFGSLFYSDVINGAVIPTDTVSDRLIVDVHLRMPAQFVGVAYVDDKEWGSTSDMNTLDMQMYLIYYKFTLSGGLPVIFGDFGAADKENSDSRTLYASYYVATAYSYGITCFWHDDNNAFALYNRSSAEQLFPEIILSMKYAIS